MQRALQLIDEWPVPTAAAGARVGDATVVVRGEADRPFRLASVTKVLTAVAVLVAVEEGTLGLDEPVPTPPGATVRDLLAHSSGIAPDRDEALMPPRRKRVYSNRGYELLGDLVTERSGIAFADYLREAVLEPLGMSATTLEGSPAADAVSTVHDLLRFAAAIVPGSGAGVLSDDTLAALATPQFPDLDGVLPGYGRQVPNPWGLGPEIRGTKSPHWTGSRNSPATFGHFGQAGTFLWVDPAAGVSLVALTDRDFGDWALPRWPALSDAVLEAHGA